MHPTLFTIGRFAVPSYTVLLDLGLILGLVLAYHEGKRLLGDGEATLDAGLWTIVGGIIGGRLGFVVANWEVFRENLIRIVRVWEGGLAFHGAFLGGLIALALAAFLVARPKASDGAGRGRATLKLADSLTPGLAVALAFGWVGCLLYGSAYGVVGQGFGYAVLPDVSGVEAPRFATQAFGLAESLILLALVWLLRKRWPSPGVAFTMFGLLYFAGQFFLENTRGDQTLYVAGWRLPQILDAVLALLFAVALLVLWWGSRAGAESLADEPGEGPPEEPEGEIIEVEEPAGEEEPSTEPVPPEGPAPEGQPA